MISISQLAVKAFMIYIFWFREAYGHNPIILYGTVLIATITCILDLIVRRSTIQMNKILTMFFLFGIYSFVSGLLISRDQSHFIDMMVTYFSFVVVCWDVFYISYRKGEISWIMKTIVLVSLLCAAQTIFMGVGYQTEVLVTTMGSENNPHTLGYTMLLGIFAIIFDEKKIKQNFVLKIAVIITFIYVILLCGSRKSLLCIGIILLYWIVNILKSEKKFTIRKLLIVVTILIGVAIGVYYFLTKYVNTEMFERLLLLFEEEGAVAKRGNLYLDAFEYWKTNLLFGIGFGQYQIWSPYGYYSHSSYAEILSCTGMIGMLIFFIPILKLVFSVVKTLRQKKNIYGYALCLLMFAIELLLGAGQIFIYSFQHMLCLICLEMRYNELRNQSEASEYSHG